MDAKEFKKKITKCTSSFGDVLKVDDSIDTLIDTICKEFRIDKDANSENIDQLGSIIELLFSCAMASMINPVEDYVRKMLEMDEEPNSESPFDDFMLSIKRLDLFTIEKRGLIKVSRDEIIKKCGSIDAFYRSIDEYIDGLNDVNVNKENSMVCACILSKNYSKYKSLRNIKDDEKKKFIHILNGEHDLQTMIGFLSISSLMYIDMDGFLQFYVIDGYSDLFQTKDDMDRLEDAINNVVKRPVILITGDTHVIKPDEGKKADVINIFDHMDVGDKITFEN